MLAGTILRILGPNALFSTTSLLATTDLKEAHSLAILLVHHAATEMRVTLDTIGHALPVIPDMDAAPFNACSSILVTVITFLASEMDRIEAFNNKKANGVGIWNWESLASVQTTLSEAAEACVDFLVDTSHYVSAIPEDVLLSAKSVVIASLRLALAWIAEDEGLLSKFHDVVPLISRILILLVNNLESEEMDSLWLISGLRDLCVLDPVFQTSLYLANLHPVITQGALRFSRQSHSNDESEHQADIATAWMLLWNELDQEAQEQLGDDRDKGDQDELQRAMTMLHLD